MVDESTIVVPIIIVMWDWKFIVELAVDDLIYVERIPCGKMVTGCIVRYDELFLLKSNIESGT